MLDRVSLFASTGLVGLVGLRNQQAPMVETQPRLSQRRLKRTECSPPTISDLGEGGTNGAVRLCAIADQPGCCADDLPDAGHEGGNLMLAFLAGRADAGNTLAGLEETYTGSRTASG